MASVTTSLALGAKQAVRGAKLAGKRTAAPKAVNVTAKAQISKGTRPPSFAQPTFRRRENEHQHPSRASRVRLLSPVTNARRR